MKLTLRQLTYFDALARERHFGKAAARVSVTQPAMSAQIRELEAILGTPLVDRSGTRITLTPLGRAVAAKANRLLEDAAAIEALADPNASAQLPLRLGMIPTVAPYLLPRFMALAAKPDHAVVVSEAMTGDLLNSIRVGDLDAAVIALPSGRDDLIDIELFEDRLLLATPTRKVRPDWQVPANPTDVDPSRLLMLDEGHCLADQAMAACNLRRETLGTALGATSLATISRLVASGIGITLLPEIAAEVEGRDLVLSHFKRPEPKRRIGLTARRGAQNAGWLTRLAKQLTTARNGDAQIPALQQPRRNSRKK